MKNIFIVLLLLSVVSCNKKQQQVPPPSPPPNYNSVHLNTNLNYGSITDIDGNSYATIQIGSQVWMAENLKAKRFANGDTIPEIAAQIEWQNNTSNPGWSYLNNNMLYDSLKDYGLLYNFYTVIDSRNVCPTGWHVPTDSEWTVLVASIDPWYNANAIGSQSSVAGGKLKSTGTDYWKSPNTGATNETGFSGVPSSHKNSNGNFSFLGNDGDIGIFWSSTGFSNPADAYYRSLNYNDGSFNRNIQQKRNGFSVRCIQD
jgi:uncharacterized protein (TIGR02145 family)